MARKKPVAEIEPDCPVPDTHRRLASAHRLWHQTLKEYGNPDGFRTNLNATIQELRNVTFILQKEHRKIPNFDEWYAPHQRRLKNAPLLRWVVDARNQVVKEGDLATHSKATVSVVDSYLDERPWSTDVPPFATTKQIAVTFAERAPPGIRDAHLVVERRWEIDDLPGMELLDALAQCYGVLASIVADAHRAVGHAHVPTVCPPIKNAPTLPPSDVPACMRTARQLRTVRIDLNKKAFATMRWLSVKRSAKHVEVAKQRYGEWPALTLGGGYEAIARRMHDMARTIIQKDPELLTAVQLYKNGACVHGMMLLPGDKADKYALWREVAAGVESFDADAVIANVESWLYRLDNPDARRECVQTFYERSDGSNLQLTSVFRREGDKIVLEAAFEDATELNILEPTRAVWRKRAAGAG